MDQEKLNHVDRTNSLQKVFELSYKCPHFVTDLTKIEIKICTVLPEKDVLEAHVFNDDNGDALTKQFSKELFCGDIFFHEFIEPASRILNFTSKYLIWLLLQKLDIHDFTVVVNRIICMTERDGRYTVDTTGLDEVLKSSRIIRQWLGLGSSSTVRGTVHEECTTHDARGEELKMDQEKLNHPQRNRKPHKIVLDRYSGFIRLRAVNEEGQTISRREIPNVYLHNPSVTTILLKRFCENLDCETALTILHRDLERVRSGQFRRTARFLQQCIKEIRFDNEKHAWHCSVEERATNTDAKAADQVEREHKNNQETIRQREVSRAAAIFNSPKLCKKCGKNSGCMCPREEKNNPPKPLCQHLVLTKVSPTVAVELGIPKEAAEAGVYFCSECHQAMGELLLPTHWVLNQNGI